MLEVKSVMSYLLDEIDRNQERIKRLQKYIKSNPLESIIEVKRGKKIYYYKKFWQDGNSQYKYFGNSNSIDIKQVEKDIIEKKKKKEDVRKRCRMLIDNKKKLLKLLNYAERINSEH